MKRLFLILLALLPLALLAQEVLDPLLAPAPEPIPQTTLTADRLVMEEGKGRARFEGKVLLQSPEEKLTLRSSTLVVQQNLGTGEWLQAEALGDVILNKDAWILYAAQFRVDREQKLSEWLGSVMVTDGQIHLAGERMEYFYQDQTGRILAKPPARVQFIGYRRLEKDEIARLEAWADEARFDQRNLKFILQGKVKVLDVQNHVILESDRAEFFFDEEKELSEGVLSGDFSLKEPGRFASSEKAFLNFRNERITLTGNAKVEDDRSGSLSSNRIEIYMDQNRGIIQGQKNQPLKLEIPLD